MVKKMTISVSDELHEKAEVWRSELNFSRVFQEALAREVASKEAFSAALKGEEGEMTAIAKRLRVERDEVHAVQAKAGKKDGLDWAKSAHYEDLVWISDVEDLGDDPRDCINETVSKYFTEMVGDFPILEDERMLDEYAYSWLEGVQAFWNEIQPLIDKA